VNARLLAGLLNSAAEAEKRLAERDIVIPDGAPVCRGPADTTTDQVTLYTQDCQSSTHTTDLGKGAFLVHMQAATRSEVVVPVAPCHG
jgi:uncharacterized protein YbcC (UPF0753/DUF2309 family)